MSKENADWKKFSKAMAHRVGAVFPDRHSDCECEPREKLPHVLVIEGSDHSGGGYDIVIKVTQRWEREEAEEAAAKLQKDLRRLLAVLALPAKVLDALMDMMATTE